MKIKMPKKRGSLSPALLWGCVAVGLLIAAVGSAGQAFAEESTTVSCYNMQYSEIPVGNAVVFDTSQAAQVCNQMYYNCKGVCIGCFSDFDYVDAVCVNIWGETFLK